MRYFREIRRLTRDFGVGGMMVYLLQSLSWRSRGWIRVFRYLIVVQPAPPAPTRQRASQRLRIRQVDASEYQADWFPRPMAVIEDRFAQGSVCFVAFLDENPIGCLWLVEREYREDEVACVFVPRPSERAVWDYDVYVDPEHRLGRAFVRLWQSAGSWLREHGYDRTVSRINAFNLPSIQAHQRAGAKPLGSMTFVSIGLIQLAVSTIKPRLSVCFGATGMPRYEIPTPDHVA